MGSIYRRRRTIAGLICIILALLIVFFHPDNYSQTPAPPSTSQDVHDTIPVKKHAREALDTLEIKGRAAKTGYSRAQFGEAWLIEGGCDMRNLILYRDLEEVIVDQDCNVMSGVLFDPYTSKTIRFLRGPTTSPLVQIDHVVALSDAWQKGAADWDQAKRIAFANDPLELLAVDGEANNQKSNGDAATWLPPNKAFRCQYVARQIGVKQKYRLWVTQAEYDTMKRILGTCPDQQIPVAKLSPQRV